MVSGFPRSRCKTHDAENEKRRRFGRGAQKFITLWNGRASKLSTTINNRTEDENTMIVNMKRQRWEYLSFMKGEKNMTSCIAVSPPLGSSAILGDYGRTRNFRKYSNCSLPLCLVAYCVPLSFHSRYKKYVPAAYATMLNKPKIWNINVGSL